MSVATLDDFLGQEIQRTAVGASFERHVLSTFASSALRGKDVHEIGRARDARDEPHAVLERLEEMEIVRRCVFDMNGEARPDPQLGRKWRP